MGLGERVSAEAILIDKNGDYRYQTVSVILRWCEDPPLLPGHPHLERRGVGGGCNIDEHNMTTSYLVCLSPPGQLLLLQLFYLGHQIIQGLRSINLRTGFPRREIKKEKILFKHYSLPCCA